MLAELLVAAALAADSASLARRPTPSISPPPMRPAATSPVTHPPGGPPRARAVGLDDPPADDTPDAWFGADKVKHFFIAGFVESVAFGVVRSAGASSDGALATGFGVGAAVSIGKEMYDRRSGRPFSVRDLVWDAAGLLAHAALLAQVDG